MDIRILIISLISAAPVLMLGLPIMVILGMDVFLWRKERSAGVPVPFRQLIRLNIHRVNARNVVDAIIHAANHGLTVDPRALATHEMAGGDVSKVTEAWIVRTKAGESPEWDTLCALDLAGRDPVQDDFGRSRR